MSNEHPTSTHDCEQRDSQPVLAIVGVGNELMRDDGVGPKLVSRLLDTDLQSNDSVRLTNAGTTGFLALEAMSGCEYGLVVDAVRTDAEPGAVHEYVCVEGTFEGDVPEMTMHDVSFTEALSYSRSVYELPDEIRIIGIEPAVIEPGLELSETVEATSAEVLDMITAYTETVVAAERTGTDDGTDAPETERSASEVDA